MKKTNSIKILEAPTLNLSILTQKLVRQVQPLENFSGIIKKAKKDGYTDIFFKTLDPIFKAERNFTLNGLLKRVQDRIIKQS